MIFHVQCVEREACLILYRYSFTLLRQYVPVKIFEKLANVRLELTFIQELAS